MRIRRLMALSTALLTAVALSTAPVYAAGPKAKAPKTNGKQASAKPSKPAKAPKTTSTANGRGAKPTTVSGKGKKTTTTTTTASTSTTDTSSTSSTSTSTSSTGDTWTPNNAVAEKLAGKPKLLAKAKAVLPEGTDINDATMGFKNFGQFNAAVNVSQNLGIDFDDLKGAMTGYTLDGEATNKPTKSLGQAIQQLKPGVDADAEATTATTQANSDGGQ